MTSGAPHPEWIQNLLDELKPYQQQVVESQIFSAVTNDRLTKQLAQGATVSFYPLVKNFPRYLELNLAKVPPENNEWNQKTRAWFRQNIRQERVHILWWRKMAQKFGVAARTLDRALIIPPEIDAINEYLCQVCAEGSLAEAVSAANFAVEGATGEWTQLVKNGFIKYPHVEDIEISEHELEWITAHATYDDRHPIEALEIIKAYATTDEEQKKVKESACRALRYYASALASCYQQYSTQ